MKANLDTGLSALKMLLEVVNTKEKVMVLILLWVLGASSYGVLKIFTPETIERLFCLAFHQNSSAHHLTLGGHEEKAPIVPRG